MEANYQRLKEVLPPSMMKWNQALKQWLLVNIPGLAQLAVTPQDPIHHAEGDVLTHTWMVCEALLKSKTYLDADPDGKFIMFYAALLHDIAKPLCTKITPEGRVTSAGHSAKGSVDTRILLWKAQVPFEIREEICNIIAVHQVPFFALKDKDRTPQYIVHQLSHQLTVKRLIAVARADMEGRYADGQTACLEDIAIFEMIAEEEQCLEAPKLFPDKDTKLEYFSTNGAISPDYPFFKEQGATVYVMCGIPASGKDFFIKKNMAKIPVIGFDMMKAEMGLTEKDNTGSAVHAVIDQAKVFLREKQDFVWNATHLSRQMRAKTLDLIHRYNGKSVIVYLEQPYDVIMQRNDKRDSSLKNSKIEEMLFKWELPTSIEAWDMQTFINLKTK